MMDARPWPMLGHGPTPSPGPGKRSREDGREGDEARPAKKATFIPAAYQCQLSNSDNDMDIDMAEAECGDGGEADNSGDVEHLDVIQAYETMRTRHSNHSQGEAAGSSSSSHQLALLSQPQFVLHGPFLNELLDSNIGDVGAVRWQRIMEALGGTRGAAVSFGRLQQPAPRALTFVTEEDEEGERDEAEAARHPLPFQASQAQQQGFQSATSMAPDQRSLTGSTSDVLGAGAGSEHLLAQRLSASRGHEAWRCSWAHAGQREAFAGSCQPMSCDAAWAPLQSLGQGVGSSRGWQPMGLTT